MNTYYIALFALLSAVLGAAAVLMHQKLHRCEKQMRDLHLQKTQEYADSIHLHMIQESLWQSVNTIHLLAALAEEESSSEDVKETQRMICAECEKIQQQLYTCLYPLRRLRVAELPFCDIVTEASVICGILITIRAKGAISDVDFEYECRKLSEVHAGGAACSS